MTTSVGRLPPAPAGERAEGEQAKGAQARGGRPGPSRAADRAARRAFHSRRILPALLAALLVTAAGLLTAIEAISALTGDPARLVPYDRVTSWAWGTSWKEAAGLLAAAVTTLVGLFFLVAGLRRGRGRLIPLHGDDPDVMVAITRRGLRGIAGSAARDVAGVTDVGRVKVRRRKVKLTAGTAMRDPGDLRSRVETAVRERLDEAGPLPRRGVAVRIRKPKE
ncbi:DUF6286 domain-containing protein [Actinomadura sp. 9N407]|uniref:DUF6286 domain-containing protein n=1 Tax=Actinomadura sp. 9N407 TaxID=3375154 RepID=UPI00379055D8